MQSPIFAFEGDKGVEFAAGVDKPAEAAFRRAMAASAFKGSAGQSLELLAPEWSDSARVILVGVGKKGAVSDLTWQKAGAGLVKKLLVGGPKTLAVVGAPDRMAAANLAFGARLAGYRFDQYRLTLKAEKKPTLATVSVVTDSAAGARSDFAATGRPRPKGSELARDLVSEPPNILHPESYADRIAKLAEVGTPRSKCSMCRR